MESVMALGLETIRLSLVLHPNFCLVMNWSQTLFLRFGIDGVPLSLLTWGLSTNPVHLHYMFFICYVFLLWHFLIRAKLSPLQPFRPDLWSPHFALNSYMTAYSSLCTLVKRVPTLLYSMHICILLPRRLWNCSILLTSFCFKWGQ